MRDHNITHDALNDLKDSIDGTKEDLEDQLDQMREAIQSADASIRKNLQADQTRLLISLKSIEWAQQVANTTQPKIVIQSNRAGQEAREIFGTDTSQPQFSLDVLENEAGLGATMAAGAHTPEALQALLGDSQAQSMALALQAVQTQLPNSDTHALQSLLHTLSVKPQRGDHFSNPRITENSDPAGFIQVPMQSFLSAHREVNKEKAWRG